MKKPWKLSHKVLLTFGLVTLVWGGTIVSLLAWG